jgi:hypothetical protein
MIFGSIGGDEDHYTISYKSASCMFIMQLHRNFMVIINANIVHSDDLQNLHKLAFLVWKQPI